MNGQVIVHDWQDNFLPDRTQSVGQDNRAPRSSDAGFGAGVNVMIGATPQTGLPYSESIAMTSATAYACSRARAEMLAGLPSIVYEQMNEFTRRRARQTAPWQLLYDDPNPFMDAMNFYELVNMRQVNRGNGFCEIERDNADNPIALWPIHPSRVYARVERDGTRWRLYWDVMTDVKDPTDQNYIYHRVEHRNMLNVCGFGGNGLIAPGVIDMGRESISLDLASQRYGSSYFRRGGRPMAVVEHPGYIDNDDQRREFRADMNQMHSGVERWHDVPVMWEGAKWKEIQANPEQAQFLETRGFSARELCRLWNVPPALVQIFDDYKFNTVDAMIMQFVMTCVRNDAIRVERAITSKVLHFRDARGRMKRAFDDKEFFLEFLLEGLLRGDAYKQSQTLEIKRRNGVINGNEWRAIDNLNPIGPAGDKYVLPGGFGDLEAIGAAPPSKPATSGGGSDNASASNDNLADVLLGKARERLIGAVDRTIGARRNVARGAALPGAKRSVKSRGKLIRTMALNQLAEAMSRIDAVLENDRDRVVAKGQQYGTAHWNRHRHRLESALLPGCVSYAMCDDRIRPDVMAAELAKEISERQANSLAFDLRQQSLKAAKDSMSKGDDHAS